MGYGFQYSLSILFSFILIPILANKIGFSNFGEIGRLLSISSLLIVFINYSFSITAVPKFALENNQEKKIDMLAHIIFCRILLSFISILVLFFILKYLFNVILINSLLVLSLFLLSTGLNTTWYLQAEKKFSKIIVLNLFSTTISFFVYLYLNHINSLNTISSVLFLILLPQTIFNISTFLVSNLKELKIVTFSFNKIYQIIISDFLVFLSQFISSIYVMIGPIILVAFSNKNEAGIFTILDRINNLISAGLLMFFSLVLPELSILFKNNFVKYKQYIVKIIAINIFIIFFIFLSFILFNNRVLMHLFHSTDIKYSLLILLSLAYIFLASFGPITTNHFILINKKNNIIKLTFAILFITLTTSSLLTKGLGSIGWMLSTIIGQFTLLITFIFFFKKQQAC